MIPVIDGHNDVLLAAHNADRDGGDFLREATEGDADGHLDLKRCKEGGLAAGFFAAFVPKSAEEDDADPADSEGDEDAENADAGEDESGEDGEGNKDSENDDFAFDSHPPAVAPDVARAETFDMLAHLHRWNAATDADAFRLVSDLDDLQACVDGPVVGAIPHVEGAAAVTEDVSNLDLLYAAGVRSIGLTWSRPNAFGHGVPFVHDASPDTGPGLTEAGRKLVRACEERGILVDLAHLNEAGFWDVAELIDRPLVVSHSAVHEISPAARNLTDEQLAAVADADGLVGLTFAVSHLRPDGERAADTPLSVLLDHIDHLVDRMGVEHVALGSDFDGATVPDPVGDVTGLQRVLTGLADRGYSRAEREAIAHGNWLRVLDEWWD